MDGAESGFSEATQSPDGPLQDTPQGPLRLVSNAEPTERSRPAEQGDGQDYLGAIEARLREIEQRLQDPAPSRSLDDPRVSAAMQPVATPAPQDGTQETAATPHASGTETCDVAAPTEIEADTEASVVDSAELPGRADPEAEVATEGRDAEPQVEASENAHTADMEEEIAASTEAAPFDVGEDETQPPLADAALGETEDETALQAADTDEPDDADPADPDGDAAAFEPSDDLEDVHEHGSNPEGRTDDVALDDVQTAGAIDDPTEPEFQIDGDAQSDATTAEWHESLATLERTMRRQHDDLMWRIDGLARQVARSPVQTPPDSQNRDLVERSEIEEIVAAPLADVRDAFESTAERLEALLAAAQEADRLERHAISTRLSRLEEAILRQVGGLQARLDRLGSNQHGSTAANQAPEITDRLRLIDSKLSVLVGTPASSQETQATLRAMMTQFAEVLAQEQRRTANQQGSA
jgi:hypothetical protein